LLARSHWTRPIHQEAFHQFCGWASPKPDDQKGIPTGKGSRSEKALVATVSFFSEQMISSVGTISMLLQRGRSFLGHAQTSDLQGITCRSSWGKERQSNIPYIQLRLAPIPLMERTDFSNSAKF
jgi:hypothetical protein